MPTRPAQPNAPDLTDQSRFTFTRRLKEIDMFFQGRSPVQQTLRRLVRWLEKGRIPYAIMGAMAVNAHGARRTTDDVDVLLNAEGFTRLQRELTGSGFERVAGRPRRLVDK